MTNLFRKIPWTLSVTAIILYLSLFKPPQTDLDEIPNFDKFIHIGMYGFLATVAWLECLWRSTKRFELFRTLLVAFFTPIFLSGMIELGQEYLTTYRGGDWMDFLANCTGTTLAGALGYFVLRPWILKIRLK